MNRKRKENFFFALKSHYIVNQKKGTEREKNTYNIYKYNDWHQE